jgi:aminoglycoside phosphotransferase (APT) family kinase protein
VIALEPVVESLLEAGIAAAFPQTNFADFAIIDRGFGSIVVGVPQQVVARVPRSETVAAAHRHERALLLSIAKHVGVSTPHVTWVTGPAPALPWGASAYRWIDGSQPVVPVSPESALVHDLARFIATLHRIPVADVIGIDVPGPSQLARARAYDAAVAEPALRARLRSDEFSRIRTRLANVLNDPILDRFVPVLRHGDLWFGNTLVDGRTASLHAVLDWEHAAIGDPAEDIATQRYLGHDAAAAVTTRYAQLVGGIDPHLLQRADHHFALREISGIRRCIEMSDDDELDQEIQTLRRGPLLT